jgi:formate hydrogenlyase subunit 6/NADH:ubiquinone oxidoreductase subunit I
MNCLATCKKGAITYQWKKSVTGKQEKKQQAQGIDKGRRSILTGTASLAAVSLLHAQEKTTDGGLAIIVDKKIPKRDHPIRPAGAKGEKNFTKHCTACQLCVSACPNDVLRPSENWETLMQPEMSFERGYCRPECTRCSEVCPTGAIRLIDKAEKSATQIGHAVWIQKNCIAANDKDRCDNCARHCPTGAIQMIEQKGQPFAPKIPAINTERCIGCGACEHLCPARPFSAIYIEGHEQHRTL